MKENIHTSFMNFLAVVNDSSADPVEETRLSDLTVFHC
jgi:hypothetical protein